MTKDQANELKRLIRRLELSLCNLDDKEADKDRTKLHREIDSLTQQPAELTDSPAWHDAPTCCGWWIIDVPFFGMQLTDIEQPYIDGKRSNNINPNRRYFGPIPKCASSAVIAAHKAKGVKV